jgi:hypothetical protein
MIPSISSETLPDRDLDAAGLRKAWDAGDLAGASSWTIRSGFDVPPRAMSARIPRLLSGDRLSAGHPRAPDTPVAPVSTPGLDTG